MHDVAYWREKAGIAALFVGNRSDKPIAKAAGKILNDILTRKPPLLSQDTGIDLVCHLSIRQSTLVAGRSFLTNPNFLCGLEGGLNFSLDSRCARLRT
jgi:hypothetical protein